VQAGVSQLHAEQVFKSTACMNSKKCVSLSSILSKSGFIISIGKHLMFRRRNCLQAGVSQLHAEQVFKSTAITAYDTVLVSLISMLNK